MIVQTAQYYLFLLLYLGVFVTCVVALVDALRRPSAAFVSASKRTKGFWGGVLGVAVVVSFVAIPLPGNIGARLGFLALAAAVAAIVYLVDVRPAVRPYGGGGRRPGRPGGW